MSNPKPMPPKSQVQLDLNEADTITCKECGNASFIQSFFLKRISALISPTGKEAIVPIQVFACGNCGMVPQKMIEGTGLETGDK